MPAAYDSYDYPSYWVGREYEHASEGIAIKRFLEAIPKIGTACEVGAGFGRLIPTYVFRANKVIITEPSARLLGMAKLKYSPGKNIRFVQSSLANLSKKIKAGSLDLAIFVRVLHHMEDIDAAIEAVCHLVKPGGHLILEFANKRHLKATIFEFLKGNFTFPMDIFPKDLRSRRSLKKDTLPFFNYHPDDVKYALERCHFKIVEKLSVSNVRSSFIKRVIPTNTLVLIEKYLQKPLSYINFGPSIFILAKKRPN